MEQKACKIHKSIPHHAHDYGYTHKNCMCTSAMYKSHAKYWYDARLEDPVGSKQSQYQLKLRVAVQQQMADLDRQRARADAERRLEEEREKARRNRLQYERFMLRVGVITEKQREHLRREEERIKQDRARKAREAAEARVREEIEEERKRVAALDGPPRPPGYGEPGYGQPGSSVPPLSPDKSGSALAALHAGVEQLLGEVLGSPDGKERATEKARRARLTRSQRKNDRRQRRERARKRYEQAMADPRRGDIMFQELEPAPAELVSSSSDDSEGERVAAFERLGGLRPAFHPYGQGNTDPGATGGFVFGTYLRTHNVNPEVWPNLPQQPQLHRQARQTFMNRRLAVKREQEAQLAEQKQKEEDESDLTKLSL